jgi:glycosyl transferase family 25
MPLKNIPIFVVNLARDIEKKEYIYSLCKNEAIHCEFIEAVYGRDLSNDYLKTVYDKDQSIKNFGRELTLGELGCALSHIAIYKKMIAEKIEVAIVFEDDITIESDFKNVIASINKLPKNWDCVLLGHYPDAAGKVRTLYSFWERRKVTKYSNLVRLLAPIYGTHGYLINNRGAQKLLDSMQPILKPVDHYTNNESVINLYGITPPVIKLHDIFSQNSSISQERIDMRNKYSSNSENLIDRIGTLQLIKNIQHVYMYMRKSLSNFVKKTKKPYRYN